ncbi:unnamed protein product [Diamesa serratosioi]
MKAQIANYYPKTQVPAKISTYQESTKGQRHLESPSISTVIRRPNQILYNGQKSSGISTFRPIKNDATKLYSGSSYQYQNPSIQLSQQPQSLYAGTFDQSSALLAAYKKQ